ncbi:MAG: ABC transporter permease [Chloroflexi bacterium HGW-Chloroflexi-8]|jgi:ABC-2 type transport system permease protein|nr:MAG: ABC transporter permease [Chloroflexi bacterium HGW-Chloroflexi-8]
MNSLLKMTWMELKLFFREPIGAFFTLVFPLMMLFLFGSIYGNEPSKYFNGYGTVDISVPAYTAMIIATTGLMSLAITMSAYRENGVLRRLRTTPISPLLILTAQVVVLLLMTIIGMVLLVIAGKLVYHMRFEGNVFDVILGFILSSLSFFAIGFVIAGFMPNARTAQIVGMVILYPMLFLSGAGFPRELLPETIKKVSTFLPLTYVVNLLRGLWIGESWAGHQTEVLVLTIILIIGVLVSIKVFRWE